MVDDIIPMSIVQSHCPAILPQLDSPPVFLNQDSVSTTGAAVTNQTACRPPIPAAKPQTFLRGEKRRYMSCWLMALTSRTTTMVMIEENDQQLTDNMCLYPCNCVHPRSSQLMFMFNLQTWEATNVAVGQYMPWYPEWTSRTWPI